MGTQLPNQFLCCEYLGQTIKKIQYLPNIEYEDLLYLSLSIYQLKMARSYLWECYKNWNFCWYTKSNKKYHLIKVVNTKSRFKKRENRTLIIIFDKMQMSQMKEQKTDNREVSINLWNAMHFWCNCNRETCTITPCSHVMIFCFQNDIEVKQSLHNEKLLHLIDFGLVYKQWTSKNEKHVSQNVDHMDLIKTIWLN